MYINAIAFIHTLYAICLTNMIERRTVCERIKVKPEKPHPNSVVGLAIETIGQGVISGLRHPITYNSNGWYIWCGEYSNDKDFFSPVCIEHINDYLESRILEYLDLPPGYRFLIDEHEYEDIWFDEKLLKI